MASRAWIFVIGLPSLAAASGHTRSPVQPGTAGRIAEVVEGVSYDAIWQVGVPIRGESAAWQAPNRAQGLRSYFTPDGVSIGPWSGAGDWECRMSLASVGRAELSSSIAPTPPTVQGSRIEYARGPCSEWYVNEARGLEQRFTLRVRPPGSAWMRIRLELKIEGSLRPVVDPDRRNAHLVDARGEVVLQYAELRAFDARGCELPAVLTETSRGLAIEVDDRAATYPVRVDPLILHEDQRLEPSSPLPGQHFGISLAVDGDTLAVGAEGYSSPALNSGAVYVFVRESDRWVEQALLTAADADFNDSLGSSVDLSGDVVVAGAQWDEDLGVNSGSAYVFRRQGSHWAREAKLLAPDGAIGDFFGSSVAVSGSTIFVGAYGDDDLGFSSGSVYVFEHEGTDWVPRSKLHANDGGEGDGLGFAICLREDRAFVGAPWQDDLVLGEGALYVFDKTGPTWQQSAKIKSSGVGEPEFFGGRVDATSSRMIVSATAADGAAPQSGAVYVFENSSGTWNETARLIASDGEYNDWFGVDVAILDDTVLIGSYRDVGGAANAGTSYVFKWIRGNWEEVAELQASDATENAGFGVSVDLSGSAAIVGAFQHPPAGGVYYLGLPFQFSPYCFGDGSGAPCPCGNPSLPGGQAGCANSTGSGAHLGGAGTTRVTSDDLELLAGGLVPGQPAIAFAGGSKIGMGNGAPFGDGLRCAGTNVVRLGWRTASASGEANWGPGLGSLGKWSAGSGRYFQTYYRDPVSGPCGFGFNSTNGLEIWFED